jgi:ribosomal protein S18 acetylase RimI-like enzyme
MTDEIQLTLPTGDKLTLRRVTPADEEFLVAVYRSTRADELAPVPWTDEQKDQFVRWQYGLQRNEYQARFPNTDYRVILLNNQPAGRIWVAEDELEIRLLDIAILQEFQNRGIGTALLKRLVQEATQLDKRLRHMVFVLNDSATRFYERLGFVVFEEQGAYKHMEWRATNSS